MDNDPVERRNISIKRSLLKEFEAYSHRQRRPFSTQLSLLMEAAIRSEEDVIDAEIARQRKANATYIPFTQFLEEVEDDV